MANIVERWNISVKTVRLSFLDRLLFLCLSFCRFSCKSFKTMAWWYRAQPTRCTIIHFARKTIDENENSNQLAVEVFTFKRKSLFDWFRTLFRRYYSLAVFLFESLVAISWTVFKWEFSFKMFVLRKSIMNIHFEMFIRWNAHAVMGISIRMLLFFAFASSVSWFFGIVFFLVFFIDVSNLTKNTKVSLIMSSFRFLLSKHFQLSWTNANVTTRQHQRYNWKKKKNSEILNNKMETMLAQVNRSNERKCDIDSDNITTIAGWKSFWHAAPSNFFSS